MMFYEAVGGEGFAGLPNHYQADSDLSRLLDARPRNPGRGRHGARGSQWQQTPAAGSTPRRQSLETDQPPTVLYRFILPVAALNPVDLNT